MSIDGVPIVPRPRLIIGISGATGIIFGVRTLKAARALSIETHLVVTKAAERTLGMRPT